MQACHWLMMSYLKMLTVSFISFPLQLHYFVTTLENLDRSLSLELGKHWKSFENQMPVGPMAAHVMDAVSRLPAQVEVQRS
jgi:hypothetical protein